MNTGKDKPLVAICIPVYEKLECFKRLLKSILSQTYNNYIIIVTDDSQTNCVEEYIHTLRNNKILYFHNFVRSGASQNTNKAIEHALIYNVDIIKIMHQDDWFTYDTSLEKLIITLNDSRADVIFSGNYEVYTDKKSEHICSKEQIENVRNDISFLFRANCLGAPSNIIYKSNTVFFDSSYTWLLDVDFYLNLLPGKKCNYIYEPLISIGHDGNQLTDYFMKNYTNVLKETLSLYKKYKCVHTHKNRMHILKIAWVCIKRTIKYKILKANNTACI